MRFSSSILRRLLTALLCALICFCLALEAQAQFRDTFESTQSAWSLAAADAGVKVLDQERTFKQSRSGSGSEYLRLSIGTGTYVHLTYSPPGKAPVIAELEPSLWLKADKANLQVMVRVVLPRTTDRGTGRPLTTLLSGDTYSDVGRWQQLHVKDIFRRLDGPELIRLRREFGPSVDVRGAQVDLLVINAYSNPGNVQIWIDDIEIKGFVNQDDNAVNAARPSTNSLNDEPGAPSPSSPAQGAEVQGSMLMVQGRPFMPRIIQHQGEPLAWLQSLGFNAVKFNSSPSPALLKEAQRLGLWIVAPPPFADATAPPPDVFQPVLAWSLGNRLVDRDVPFTRDLAADVRAIDPQRQRPLVAGADCELAEYSRLATLLLLDRRTNGTSCELGEQRDWLKDRQKIARPGTPCWGVVHSQPSLSLDQQLTMFGRDSTQPNDADLEQLRLALYTNLAAGMRGILFPSETPLSIDSVPASMRTDVLRLLNYELRLVEPWISGGQLSDELSSPESGVHAAVWQTERSRLMLITQRAASQQYVTPPAPRNQFTLLIPGVPAGSYAYQVTTAGLRQLRSSLATGGLRITVDEAGTASLVVVTHDPLVIHFLNRTITDIKSDSTRLRHNLAVRRQQQITDIDQRLSAAGHPLKESATWLKDTESNLAQAQRMLATGDFPAAMAFVVKAEQLQARLRRAHWEQTAVGFHAPSASPCVAQFTTLPLHWQLAEKLRGATWSANAQGAGDFESLDVMTKAGWKNYNRIPDDIKTEVSLSLVNPHGGRSALRLAAAPRDARRLPGPLERPLVWITSSPVPVREKQIARITGWAYVPQPIVGSYDGLLIFDNLGGPDLADRLRLTRGWRQFTIYRAVPESGDLVITFALTGLGEAWVDDVQVSLLDPDPIREVARGN